MSLEVLLLAAVGLPLGVAGAVLARPTRAVGMALAPWAALPALGLALGAGPSPEVELPLPWLLDGVRLGLDATAWPFLLFSSLLWLAAGVYASGYLAHDARRHRFLAFFLAAMAGNLGLLLSLDAVGFYAFYALMSFSTYGLVVHPGGPDAERAARVYMVLVVASEVLVLTGVLAATAMAGGSHRLDTLSAALAQAPGRSFVPGLLLAGFGVKAGVLLLHVWLPLAHSLAPTPASAVLSGAMIKAGLLGWMRVLPLGGGGLPGQAEVLGGLGLAAAFYGVVVGLTQRRPKAVLAYSSVSQMGFLTVGVGLALGGGAEAEVARAALPLYALHHGLVKGALFLGVGVAQASGGVGRRWVAAGLGVLALSLGGAPLTSGALAKVALKGAAGEGLTLLLALGSVGTTLMMARFLLVLLAEAPHPGPGGARLWGPWGLLLVLSFALAWGLAPEAVAHKALTWADAWAGLWPVLLGVLGAAGAWAVGRRTGARLPEVPTGDVGVLAVRGAARLRAAWSARRATVARPGPWREPRLALRGWLSRLEPTPVERHLTRWRSLEWLLLLLVGLVFGLLVGR